MRHHHRNHITIPVPVTRYGLCYVEARLHRRSDFPKDFGELELSVCGRAPRHGAVVAILRGTR